MNIQKELDRLEDLLLSSPRIPLSRRTLINEEAFLDILDRVRMNLPRVIEQSEQVLAEREAYLQEAEQEADRIVSAAEQRATRLLDETSIMQAARAQAAELLQRTQQEAERLYQQTAAQASQIQAGADQYAEQTLAKLEAEVAQLLQVIRNGRQSLK